MRAVLLLKYSSLGYPRNVILIGKEKIRSDCRTVLQRAQKVVLQTACYILSVYKLVKLLQFQSFSELRVSGTATVVRALGVFKGVILRQ